MFSIKDECEENVSVCRGCLSTNRRNLFLTNDLDLFFTLLGMQREFCDSKVPLCWECLANIRRIQKFQIRIQNAQFILRQRLYKSTEIPITSLSSLTTVRNYSYDETVEYEEVAEETDDKCKEYDVEIIKQEHCDSEDLQTDSIYQNEVEDSFSDNEILNIDPSKVEQIDNATVIKTEDTEDNWIRKQSIRRYESKVTIKTLNVNQKELKKLCTKMVLSEQEIENVLERDKGRHKLPNKCLDCKICYRRSVDLRRHETFNHVKHKFPTKCTECNAIVPSWEYLETHWRKHNVYYKCDLCDWLSHSLPSMTRHHYRVHTRLYCCNACDYTCRTLREFSEHYKESHERIICDDCGKSFIRKRSLEIHIKRHHTPATCYECNRTYAHYHVLENHQRMYHPHLTRGDTRRELAYCVECDKQFPSVYKYRRHLATAAKHTPPKPVRVPCPECGKVFARKIRMTNHYNSVHVNTTKHRCDICNKTFCSAFSARTHRQHVHEKIPMPKNKMCDICGRGFSTNRILTNHRRTHTGERPYKCPYCPATFAQRTAMKTHEKTQHKHAPEHP